MCDQCEIEDLRHLEDFAANARPAAISNETSVQEFFHLLALQLLDPLEFKEVKMLAIEILSKMPPASVMPFVFSQLLAFLREEAPMIASTPAMESLYSPILNGLMTHPEACGIVTAKLMVYYLNRVINEDPQMFKDIAQVPFILVILLQILSIPSVDGASGSGDRGRETNVLADLQVGCMDCVALLVLRDLGEGSAHLGSLSAASLLDVVLDWVASDNLAVGCADEDREPSELAFAVEMMVLSLVSTAGLQNAGRFTLPLQVRMCGCNILLRCMCCVVWGGAKTCSYRHSRWCHDAALSDDSARRRWRRSWRVTPSPDSLLRPKAPPAAPSPQARSRFVFMHL